MNLQKTVDSKHIYQPIIMINGINESGIEIERKFLLKNLPNEINSNCDKWEYCEAYYRKDDDIWIRATKIQPNNSDLVFVQNVKTFISDGTFYEEEKYLTQEEFDKHVLESSKVIIKTRYFLTIDGLTWEIDKFHNINLIMMELEVNDITADIEFPKELKGLVIGEVTGNPDFLNVNLAISI